MRDPTQRDETKKLECRFFQEEYPEVEELVMVKVVNIADMAAEVVLLEYNDIEVRGRASYTDQANPYTYFQIATPVCSSHA